MRPVTRRTFLEVCAGVVPLAGVTLQSQTNTYVYASESWSGVLLKSPLVVGFLITRRPEGHQEAITALKRAMRYPGILTHHGNDRYKLECVRELMRYFVRDPELRFVARVVTADKHDALRPASVQVGAYPALFAAANLPPGAILRTRRRRAQWGSGVRQVNGRAEYAARIEALRSKGLIRGAEEVGRTTPDGLVELSSLLNGVLFRAHAVRSVYSDIPMRRAIALRLQTLLALESLDGQRKGKWEPAVVTVG